MNTMKSKVKYSVPDTFHTMFNYSKASYRCYTDDVHFSFTFKGAKYVLSLESMQYDLQVHKHK